MSMITIDLEKKIINVYGVNYALELFEHLGIGPVGTWLRIVKREDGVVTLERKPGGEAPEGGEWRQYPDFEDGGPYNFNVQSGRSWPDGHD